MGVLSLAEARGHQQRVHSLGRVGFQWGTEWTGLPHLRMRTRARAEHGSPAGLIGSFRGAWCPSSLHLLSSRLLPGLLWVWM